MYRGFSHPRRFIDGDFCGLSEMYAYRPAINKISVGVRLIEKYRGSGIAAEAVELMTEYLFNETDIKLIAVSTMTENKPAGKSLKKQGFKRVAHGVFENWSFDRPVAADVWIRTYIEYQVEKRRSVE